MLTRSLRVFVPCAFVVASLAAPAAAQLEAFDQAGSTWAPTLFPNLLPSGDGTFSREALTATTGAPNTTPALPINQGGDKEGRFFEVTLAPSTSYAFGTTNMCDATIDGYMSIAFQSGLGSRAGGLVLRDQGGAPINAYAARISHLGGNSATFRIVRIRNNIIGGGADTLAQSQPFNVSLSTENYRIRFSVRGSLLTASLLRVRVQGGSVVEQPIDLLAAPGVQCTLVANDTELTSGRSGVVAFARNTDGIFWDDIQVTDHGCMNPTVIQCPGDGSTVACPCANNGAAWSGCQNSTGRGAAIAAHGTSSMGADDLVLFCSGVPANQFGIFFTGKTAIQIPFGDSHLCIAPPQVRLPIQNSGACGVIRQDFPLSNVNGVSPGFYVAGDTAIYQCWYRDPGGPCGTNFSTSNALSLVYTLP